MATPLISDVTLSHDLVNYKMDAPSEVRNSASGVKSSITWCYSKCCRKEKDPKAEMKTVSLFTGYFFLINYVVGTGFLGLPFAFYFGGVLAGIFTLMAVSFLSYNTANWTLEAMARAQVCPEGRVIGERTFCCDFHPICFNLACSMNSLFTF